MEKALTFSISDTSVVARLKENKERNYNMDDWIRCPICGNKTRNKIRENTVLINYPLYCPKCKQECLINAKNFLITVIKEPDAKTQSR